MPVIIKTLPKDIHFPPDLKACGFDLTLASFSSDNDERSCRIPHPKMESVRMLFQRLQGTDNCAVISAIRFGSHFSASYNPDGSITSKPRTMIIAGEEYLESYIQLEYPYPIAIMNPVD